MGVDDARPLEEVNPDGDGHGDALRDAVHRRIVRRHGHAAPQPSDRAVHLPIALGCYTAGNTLLARLRLVPVEAGDLGGAVRCARDRLDLLPAKVPGREGGLRPAPAPALVAEAKQTLPRPL